MDKEEAGFAAFTHPGAAARRYGYLLAVAGIGLTTFARIELMDWLHGNVVLMPFFLAIIGAAWVGGLGPGLLGTALGAAASSFLLLNPGIPSVHNDGGNWIRMGLFAITGIAISLVCASMHAGRAKVEAQRRLLQRAQAELEKREGHVRFALRAGRLMTWDWDLSSGRVVRSGVPSASDNIEFPAAGHLLDAIHPDDHGVLAEARRRTLQQGAPYEVEFRVLRPDGRVLWMSSKAELRRNADDGHDHLTGVAIDITERKLAQDELRLSETRFRNMADAAPVLMWVFDTNHQCTWVNQPWLNFTGRTLEQELGEGWAQGAHPDDIEHTWSAFFAAVQKREPFSLEWRLRRHDGQYRWVMDRGTPLYGPDGEWNGYIGSCIDIDERRLAEEQMRQSEEKLRSLADSMSQLAWVARPDASIYWFNKRWYEYTGTTPQQVEGFGWQSVHHPEYLPRVTDEMRRCVATGEVFDMILPLRGADGVYRPFLTRALPLKDEHGAVVQWFGTNTDVSQQQALEQKLRDEDRRKDEFLATLAHELRNPLAPLRNELEILKRPQLDPQLAARARAVMERQVLHMTRLLDDLLDVARITRGKLELRRQQLPLASVIDSAIETSRPALLGAKHELRLSGLDMPIEVDADPVRLAQVFSNLLNNAAKYTEPGGIITLAVERQGSKVRVRVSDNGIGLAPDMLDSVFGMFSQATPALARSQGGLGIGLALARGVIELHGGSISAASAGLGKGSSFEVTLPVAIAAYQPDYSTPVPQPAELGGGRRILVADDNADARESLALLLQMSGNEVHSAGDGEEAVAVAAQFPPDVALLDIGMPRQNGYEACRRIRQLPNGRNILMVALTGWGQAEDRRRSQDAGFDAHMVKPVDPAALSRLLEQGPHNQVVEPLPASV